MVQAEIDGFFIPIHTIKVHKAMLFCGIKKHTGAAAGVHYGCFFRQLQLRQHLFGKGQICIKDPILFFIVAFQRAFIYI